MNCSGHPNLIDGGLHQDARGRVQFVNGFRPALADRFYVLHPATVGTVRGWVGHRVETKWFFAVSGRFDLAVVAPDKWVEPQNTLSVVCYSLRAEKPAMLHVPPGHFTAVISRAPGSALVVFSTGRVEDAKADDYRLPAEYWRMPDGEVGMPTC